MGVLAGFLTVTFTMIIMSPRQTGRLLAKIIIGFRAQLRDEGEA